MSLSQGPYGYNRFESLDEYYRQEEAYYRKLIQEKKSGSKPDYLDFDGDGNKDEPMKKALKEKGKKTVKEGKGEMPDFIKKKMEEKKGKKEGDDKKEKCDEELTLEEMIMGYLIENGFANNEVSAEILMVNASENWLNHIANELHS